MIENAVTKKIFFAALALTIVISSFYILDFKVARSETLIDSAVSAYSTGDPLIHFPGKVYLYVEGDDSVSKTLREKLAAELEKAGGHVSIAEAFEEKYDSQALLVNISKHKGLYTPFYASSDIAILFFYTSTGEDTKYFEQFKEGNITVIFKNTGSRNGEKLIRGDLELRDSTKGLISQKAYREHLASESAKEIVSRLEQNIRKSP